MIPTGKLRFWLLSIPSFSWGILRTRLLWVAMLAVIIRSSASLACLQFSATPNIALFRRVLCRLSSALPSTIYPSSGVYR